VAKSELLFTKGIDANITEVYQFDSNGHTLLYEAVSDRGVNVLVAGNKLCLPVLGRYSVSDTMSIFDRNNNIPCGLKSFLQDWKNQIEYSFESRVMESTHESEWYGLLHRDNIYSNRDIGNVDPLIKTQWRQKGVDSSGTTVGYEYYTPSGENCAHCRTGCVAVAMGQVMNYWKWPVLIADNWQFDWCNMPIMLDATSEKFEAERNAVARLLERCGRRAKMDYGCGESESNVYKAKKALDKMGFNTDSDHQWRIWHRRRWKSHLRENLDSGWPVIYGACGNPNINISDLQHPETFIDIPGHAFVCDGYSNDGKFHFNWGWAKYNDDFFTVDSLCPGTHDYNLFNSALFDLRPNGDVVSYCDLTLYIEVFYSMYLMTNPDSNVLLYDITPRTYSHLLSASESSATSWRTIPSNATAEYVAHEEVVLQPGFVAERGSDFHAWIDPCEACEDRMVQVDIVDGEDDTEIDTTDMSLRMFRSGDTTYIVRPSLLTLFPNPAQNTLTVHSPDTPKDVQVFDLTGRSIYRWYIESHSDNETTLNIRDLQKGTYILRMVTEDGKTHMGRFVKN